MNSELLLAVLFVLVICCTASGMEASKVKGLNGKVDKLQVAIAAADKVAPVADCIRTPDIDLKRMAQWSLEFLIRTPRPHLNYEPVFQIYPYRCPPAPEGSDPVVGCDTDARMDVEWYFMRDITGSTKGKDVEQGFHARMRGFVDAEGVTWCHPGAFNEGNITAKYEKKDYLIHMWGATKILKSLCEDYMRTHNPESKALATKMLLALKGLLKWDDQGRCWSSCGNGCLDANRDPVPNPWNPHPLPIVEPLINYYEAFNDPQALAFAKAYADGMIAGVQPDGLKFGADGSFDGHSHVTMHSVWMVAHLGVVTGEKQYTDWAKRVFDFFLRTRGTGAGWFAAAPEHPGDETCLIADMMSAAAYIARGGYPEYFDFVERYMRNRVSPSQFIITPHIRSHYAELNKEQGDEKIKYGLSELEKYQGGYLGGVGLNDWENELLNGGVYGNGPEIAMIGCCQGSGMRAVYHTWENTIAKWPKSAIGPAGVYVNLSFNRQSPWGEVFSFMPDAGRLTVKAAVQDRFFLRVPHWAPREDVRAFVDSKPIPVEWSGAYVVFAAQPGQELTITYPLVSFQQQVGPQLAAYPDLLVTYQWTGNMVMDVAPQATSTRIYTGKPRVLPPAP
jgi:hypothetical protein